MSEPTDRFVIEIGTGTVAHIIDMDADQDKTDSRFSLGLSGPGEKMCSRGNRHPGDERVSFAEFATHHGIDKDGFEGDAPDEICSYCWSNTRDAVGGCLRQGRYDLLIPDLAQCPDGIPAYR